MIFPETAKYCRADSPVFRKVCGRNGSRMEGCRQKGRRLGGLLLPGLTDGLHDAPSDGAFGTATGLAVFGGELEQGL